MFRSHENIIHISNFISKRLHKVVRVYVYGYLGGGSFIYHPMPGFKTMVLSWLFFGVEFSWKVQSGQMIFHEEVRYN